MLRVRLDCCRICRQAHAGRCCEGLGAPQSLNARQMGFFLNHGEACKAKLAHQPALEARFLFLFLIAKLCTSQLCGPEIACYLSPMAICRMILNCSRHSSAGPHVSAAHPTWFMLRPRAERCAAACLLTAGSYH